MFIASVNTKTSTDKKAVSNNHAAIILNAQIEKKISNHIAKCRTFQIKIYNELALLYLQYTVK